MSDGQFDLFGAGAPPAVGPASVPDAVSRLRERLPPGLHLGTSSWTFPGWRGLVYDREADRKALAQQGLAAYSQHPLLRTVGLDRTFYGPLDAATYRLYAAAVPESFRFLVKAPRLCTSAVVDGRPSEHLLDPEYATEAVVRPFLEGLGQRAGVLVFQFPPQSPRVLAGGDGSAFPSRLRRFLSALPAGPVYAVEVRHAGLFTPAYLDALEAAGAVHCYAVHPAMPPLARQIELASRRDFPALVLRWSLNPALSYEDARRRYQPFDRLVDEDPETRRWVVHLCLRAAAERRPAFVIGNNKAEGSAPLTLQRLAEALAA